MPMMTAWGWPRRSTTNRSFFWLMRFRICPSWVRAVTAEITLVIDLALGLMVSPPELINQFTCSLAAQLEVVKGRKHGCARATFCCATVFDEPADRSSTA